MVTKLIKIKLKKNHWEGLFTTLTGAWGALGEETIGIKISFLYTNRWLETGLYQTIETPKAYITILPIYTSRKKDYSSYLLNEKLDDEKVSEADIRTLLSVNAEILLDDEDNVCYVIDMIKRRTGRKSCTVSVNKDYMVFGYVSLYDKCFTLSDVDKLRERGVFINENGFLAMKQGE